MMKAAMGSAMAAIGAHAHCAAGCPPAAPAWRACCASSPIRAAAGSAETFAGSGSERGGCAYPDGTMARRAAEEARRLDRIADRGDLCTAQLDSTFPRDEPAAGVQWTWRAWAASTFATAPQGTR